ncbi:hypothetical protein DRJ22_02045 [Candidatus Woesearchaeota archaeon]|nr:MAG: hypothetical protein DRJ22_02045 [Candidatus Woesearchaeota archaeon]
MNKRLFWSAVFTLTGSVIGAGVLGIPFVVVRSGFWTGVLVILFIGLVVALINLLVGEVSLRTRKTHQLVGYAEKYVGRFGKWVMVGAMVVSCYGALVAYTLGVSESLFSVFGLSRLVWAVVFYVFMMLVLFGGIKRLAGSELFLEIAKFALFALIVFLAFSSSRFSWANLRGFYLPNFFLPFGVVLFAFLGFAAIPELRDLLKKNLKLLKSSVVVGSLVPILVYVLFAAAVVGISGFLTTEVATIGVAGVFGGFMSGLFHFFAVLAMSTSFIAIGYALKQMFVEDFGFTNFDAWVLVLVVPVVLISVGVHSFVRVLDVSGAVAGSVMGVLVVFMHYRARFLGNRKPEFVVHLPKLVYVFLVLFFVVGLFYSLFL